MIPNLPYRYRRGREGIPHRTADRQRISPGHIFSPAVAGGPITASSMGSPGFEQLRWLKPVRPGDTIRAEAEILEIRPSSRADRVM